ncbi:MAG: MBL fold metallo-hydrolase [Parafilimonas sp.]
MKIIPLSEGVFTIDKTKIFVPFNIEKDELQKRPVGSLLVEVQPFAVITQKDILLLDAGLGFIRNDEMQIHFNLKANNIEPHQITKVLLTHLHKDHSGGISKITQQGSYHLSFPNAIFYVQQKEFDFAMETGFPTFITEELSVLQNNSQVNFLDGDGNIDNYIQYKISGGHSPYHQVFWIEESGKKIFFGGDEAPQLQQMKSRFIAKYDFDGKKAMELRCQWWHEGNEEGWTFLFYHDVKTPLWPKQ